VSAAAIRAALESARAAEREQTQFYRALAAQAEDAGDSVLSERFQELHADEQHHLSRITARLLELESPADADSRSRAPEGGEARPRTLQLPRLEGWEPPAREREAAEVRRYEALLEEPLDEGTRGLVEQILEVERHHLRDLAGKWTPA
jgi:rubrerythrin